MRALSTEQAAGSGEAQARRQAGTAVAAVLDGLSEATTRRARFPPPPLDRRQLATRYG